MLSLVFTAALLGTSGCSTLHKSDSASVQGTWTGPDVGGGTEGPCYLIVSGKTFEFRGANTNEWYQGTFALHEDTSPKQIVAAITACSIPEYVGKTEHAIYRIEEDGTLTLTGTEPGTPQAPASFDAPDTRRLVLKKHQ